MHIDWFTVAAQALNFLILVWLLKHFLYQPILTAIDQREQRIAKELADADSQKAEAQKERDTFQNKNEAFDQQRTALLSQATDEANAEREKLLEQARQDALALSLKQQQSLKSEAKNLQQDLRQRAQREVFAIARKALADLANTSLEERLGEVFTRHLRELDSQAKAKLAEALKAPAEPALVRSAFALPAEQEAVIRNALNETFSADIPVSFETAPDIISGIELTIKGQKLSWSIGDYLASLEQGVEELLKAQDKPEAEPEAKPEAEPEADTVDSNSFAQQSCHSALASQTGFALDAESKREPSSGSAQIPARRPE